MILEMWTDGSGVTTGGPGGWAFVLRAIDDHGEIVRQREASGPIAWGTNQRAEMQALLEGLCALTRPTSVHVYSDSEYVLDGFRKGWVERWQSNGWQSAEGEDVKNRDLWEALAVQVARHEVTWHHVKGHMKTWTCPACVWIGDEPYRETPRARTRYCPPCWEIGNQVRVDARDKYPLNARCDELAGAQRRALLEGTAAPATNGSAPVNGATPAIPRRDDAPKATCGPKEHAAGVEFARYMAERRGGPPPTLTLEPRALTDVLRAVGASYAAYKRDNGPKAEPILLRADRMTWMAVDTLSSAIYGVTLTELVGRNWWPKADPPRAPQRVVDESLEALVVAVG